ncbi:MAG TPA: sulfotransferase family 2 domain-containing protein [Isosphaeraceae bacterium]|nr:sulfotransferase family 2 domain-containing protein [Isosphaeraceae bacterium]
MLTVTPSVPSAGQRGRGLRLPFGPDRPLFYLHVPKSGGTSVNVLLRRSFPAEQGVRWLEYYPRRLADNSAGLGRHPCYSGHVVYRFRDLLPARTAVMTFLRDPVDRAVSAFYFFRSQGREKLAEEQTTPGLDRCCELSLDEFLEAEPHAARVHLGNIQTWMFSQPHMYHVSPWRPLTLADLDEAKRNLERVAFVGVTARFEESIELLCRMCDWPLPDAVPHENRTPVRPGAEEVSPEARAALEELTTLDADLYRLGAALFADALRDVPLPHVPPAPSRIDLTFEGPIPGSGWFDREPRPGGFFCWTGRAAWLEFRLAGSGELALTVEVRGAVDPAQIDGLTASVNGRPVPMIRSQVGAVARFEGRVATEHVANGRYRVEFRVPRTVRPCDVVSGSTDNRELGVAVSRVELGIAEFAS